ncbi:MAG: trehalose-phosphatase [Gaiellaceae bacterium]
MDLLAPLRAAPDETALFFDVDGTLAPIVSRPELAAVPPSTRAQLSRLVEDYLLVACVSGRPGEEAARLVGVEGVRYVGNHGLELDPGAAALAGRIAEFRDAVGLPVEDKGLSLTYHYRQAEDQDAALAELERVASLATERGLDARWGRKVLEVRPRIDADKGTAVRALVAEAAARRGLYAGDDTTDLDAFAGLREANLDHTVLIAVASEESPGELERSADLVVESPEELAKLLESL